MRLTRALGLAALAVAACALATPAAAQKITGDISGTVTDATGGALPGAEVKAVCTDTGLTRLALTSAQGGFRLAELPICVYKVTATIVGFKTTTREVRVGVASLTTADFKLQIGERGEEVTVEGAAPLVELSDKLNNAIDKDRLEALPLSGRDFNAFLGITPGVQRAPGGGFLNINISGQRTESNNFMIDGISNNDRYYGGIAVGETGIVGTPATILPPDAIAEYTVQQTPSAEFGVKGGAVINVVIKSGTNELHGSAQYFRHDDWMDAKNFFTERAGDPKSTLTNQQFGGTLGGPIKKDRTFFFFYYEAQRLEVGVPYRVFVPTPDQVDEARARIAAAGLTTNPVGEALLGYYPIDPRGELTVASPNTASSDSFSLKIDHQVNDNNRLSLRGFYGRSHQSAPAFTGEIVPPAPNPPDLFNSVTDPRVYLVGATWTSTLSSNKILEVRAGYNRFSQLLDVGNKIDPKSLGIDTGPLDPGDFGVPYLDYFSYFGYVGGVGGYPITTKPDDNIDVASSLTWINGNHSLKFGGNFQRAGTFSIRNRARTTLEATGGTGYAVDSIVGLLLGRFDLASRSFGDTTRHLRQNSFGFYVNDDWKLSPRFTVTLGLRYDVSFPLGERDNLGANFFPDRGLVTLGKGIDKLYDTDWNNLGPRLGFAWDVSGNGRTAVRGGYALTYDVANFAAIHAPYSIAGARSGAFSGPAQGIFSVSLNGDLSVPPDDPAATCIDPNTGSGGDYVCVQPGVPIFGNSPNPQPPFNAFSVVSNLQTPKTHLFHFTLQHELFKGNVVTVSYVGSRGRELLRVRDLNAPPIGTDFGDPQPSRPFAQKFPDLKHIVQLTNDGKSWYNSLQVSYRQSNWKGFNSQYNLTWAHCIDTASVNRGGGGQAGQFQNPYNPDGNRGPCDHDVRINFNAGGTYRFPKIGGLGRMGEGWELATIFTGLSGRPYTAHTGRDRSGQNFDRVRADCLAPVQYNERDPDHFIANGDEAFGVPANGTVGTCGRNTIRGPNFRQWDASLIKNTPINDKVKLQFRWEVFNLLNRANFGIPTTNVRSGSFGTISSTPDVDVVNPVLAQGGPRAMQFALKVLF